MAELIVVGFKKDMYRASEVLNELLDMNDDWVVDLHDAVAVYRDYNNKLRVDQSYQATTGESAAYGGLIGLLIGGIDFSSIKTVIKAAGADGKGEVAIMWGTFFNTIISFAIIAFAIFIVIKLMNRVVKKEEAAPAAPPADVVLLTEIRDLLKKQ